MAKTELNLVNLFQAVSTALTENKTSLNEADTYNHDHGDNMVKIFQLASQAMQKKKDATPTEQLSYAGKQIQTQLNSGSAKIYADGLLRASDQLQNRQQLQADDVIKLIQSIMGTVNQTQGTTDNQQSTDALSTLLGSLGADLTNSQSGPQSGQSQSAGGLDINNLLAAGRAFLESRQRGESNIEALLDAVVSGSQMSSSPARVQSGKLVTNTLLQLLGSITQK